MKLYLHEVITNWRYIDTILFLTLLIIYVGFTDPCDRCMINRNGMELSCKQTFLNDIGYNLTEYGIQKIKEVSIQINSSLEEVNSIPIIDK